jgi:hypothetical protein
MIKLGKDSIKEIEEAIGVLEFYGASIDRDNYGQIVVYTNLTRDKDDNLLEMEEDDFG